MLDILLNNMADDGLTPCDTLPSPSSFSEAPSSHQPSAKNESYPPGCIDERWPAIIIYDKLAISNICTHAKNRNDPNPIICSKVALPEIYSAVAILAFPLAPSDGPLCIPNHDIDCCINRLL